jgi:hypothetical protein
MRGIVEAAKGHGLIAHRFYGSDDDKLLVVDEWPDPESFQAFFAEQQPQIEPIMQAAGVTSEAAGVTSDPEVVFWRKLETDDDYGRE